MNYYEQRSTEKIAYDQTIEDDTISSAAWSISARGLVSGSAAGTISGQVDTSTTTLALISGLTQGERYLLRVIIQTAGGRTFDRKAEIYCKP